MTTYGDEHYRDPYSSISPPSNNCADLTEEILEAGRYPVPGYNQYLLTLAGVPVGSPEVPKFLFENLVKSHMGRVWNIGP